MFLVDPDSLDPACHSARARNEERVYHPQALTPPPDPACLSAWVPARPREQEVGKRGEVAFCLQRSLDQDGLGTYRNLNGQDFRCRIACLDVVGYHRAVAFGVFSLEAEECHTVFSHQLEYRFKGLFRAVQQQMLVALSCCF